MRNLIGFVLIFNILSLSGCGEKGEYVAKVGKDVFTEQTLEGRISKLPQQYQEIIHSNKEKFLNDVISDSLLYQEAMRQGIDKQPDIKELFEQAKKKILIAKLLQETVDSTNVVDEDQMRAFYDANLDTFKTPEIVRASHIMVKTEPEARKTLGELKQGASFTDLARERSIDPSGKRGGDLGFFKKGQIEPDFEKACFSLNTGELSGVVKTKYGYHIILLTDRTLPSVEKFADVKERIKEHLLAQKRKASFEQLVMALKTKFKVIVNESSPFLVSQEEKKDDADVQNDIERIENEDVSKDAKS
ncbi:MAG: peptidylprolyl isomerase [Candidatus Omnitrophica bacterium]|nr:peptidylprolyl isomerase [Candidatus Omnitrophota bacterium]